ncbi:MAG: ABC transporter permease [Clostridia bacterium]|nr:ABC transporter permease [Clostridia bacterium]
MEKIARKKKKRVREYSSPGANAWHRLTQNRAAMISLGIMGVFLICALFPSVVAGYGYDDQNYAEAFMAPCRQHPFGTDNLGRDILSRIIWGARMSLFISITSVLVGLLIGGAFGATAAFFGGRVDDVIMRMLDVLLAIPSMLLAIGLAAAFGSGMFNLIMAIAISDVPRFARIVRSSIMTVKDNEYVQAAVSIGNGNLRLLLRHMLPNALAPIIVQGTLGIAGGILSTSGLSFLGLGIQPPTPEWGLMLSQARQYIRGNWWIVTFPGITIMVAIGAINLLGDGLRDALDPRLKI